MTENLNANAAAVLEAAAGTIASGWIQKKTASDGEGTTFDRWDVDGARCFCTGAAIGKAATELFGEDPIRGGPVDLRARRLFVTLDPERVETLSEDDATNAIVDINDAPGATQQFMVDRLWLAANVARAAA